MDANETEFLALRFESHRSRLRAVAHRMLGSLAEADDAVQEAWFRLVRTDARQVENLGGWLTTVVGRVCLDMLRSRRSRAEEPLEAHARVPAAAGADPEQDTLLADSVGVALLVVLETLSPPERLAFVLHDLFGVSYEEIGTVVGRSPVAARQLASRARRRVRGAEAPGAERARQARQWQVVDAFLAATRDGDFAALVELLDPDVIARADTGVTSGATAVAEGATTYGRYARVTRPALVDGVPGIAAFVDDRVERALTFTFVRDRIAVIDIVTAPDLVARLDVRLRQGLSGGSGRL